MMMDDDRKRHMHPWGPCWADHPSLGDERFPADPNAPAVGSQARLIEASEYPFTAAERERMGFTRWLIAHGCLVG
jgi:hypothetical protein